MSEIVLGTPEYPLVDVVNQGVYKIDGAMNLGVRADEALPIVLKTNVKAPDGISLNDYVYGMYIRSLPVRSMLQAANDEIDKRNKNNDWSLKTFVSGFLGAPGTGKTFYFTNLGRLLHSKGALLVDCSEKDAKTLFENPEFDASSANREKAAIDMKIKYRNMKRKDGLSDESLALLKEIAGSAVKEDDNGRVTVDWSAVRFSGETIEAYEYDMQVFYKTLSDICIKENVPVSADKSNIGIVMKDGELFRVFDPSSPDYGRPVILDELNRAKFGTLDNLYGLLNFLNSPGVKKFKITGANNREIVIDKEKIPETFYLNFTGNQAVEGMGSQVFNDPFLSRVPEGFTLKTIPDLTALDYADMICSYLMGGVPGLILRDAFGVADNPQKKKEFVEFLKKVRTIGLTETEIAEIPMWQKVNIQNAENIMALSLKLGNFLYEVKELAHQRGAYTQMRPQPDIGPEYEAYLSKRMIDFRTIPYFFTEADHIKAQISSASKFPAFGETNRSHFGSPSTDIIARYAKRGERLEEVIADWLYMTFCPKDKGVRKIEEKETEMMYDCALELAYANLILPKNTKESVANKKTISSLYNCKITDLDCEKDVVYKGLRDAIVSVLKDKYEELKDDTADDILSVGTLSAALKVLHNSKEFKEDQMIVFNEDPDTLKAKLVTSVNTQNNQSLISTENLLISLSLHQITEKNIKNLIEFQENIFASNDDFEDEDIKMTALKTENLQTKDPSVLFVLYNKEKNKLIIIGDAVNCSVLNLFNSPDRMYIDRNNITNPKDILQKIEKFIETDLFSLEETLFKLLPSEKINDISDFILKSNKIKGAIPLSIVNATQKKGGLKISEIKRKGGRD